MKNSEKFNNIDFHAHILHGVDHGSDSLDTSLLQLKMAAAAGVDVVVATPHFYPHQHNMEVYIAKRRKAYESLIDAVEKADIKCEVILGSEILLCDNLDKLGGLSQLAVSGTKNLLIELPFSDFRESYIYTIERLMELGFSVILAHAERYDTEHINQLLSLGVNIQLNASVLSGILIKRNIKDWIDLGVIYALGSDIHMNDKKAYRDFERVMKKSNKLYIEIMKKTNTIIYDM